ncbi:hypothetical protein M514_26002 [Trichuris suis]|uniref:Uncharacterized protein n=1 Tax=Trichuris suis TaxID=68888 RepID=A0A085MXA8_9BILA|nr:hypothetical protein M514_26002 [Trichuris suis]
MLHLFSVDPAVSVCSLLGIVPSLGHAESLRFHGVTACSFACNVFSECCILLISCTTLKTGRVLVKEDIAVESVWNNGRVA